MVIYSGFMYGYRVPNYSDSEYHEKCGVSKLT